ncbi:uncharacterized protein LOC114673863 [Macaca mulatta]
MTYSSRLPHTTTRRLDAGYMQRDRDVTLQQPRGKPESVPGAGCGLAIQAHERIQEAVLKTCREVFSNVNTNLHEPGPWPTVASPSKGRAPRPTGRRTGQGSQEASCRLRSADPGTKASAGPGWVLVASCLFHGEGQKEIQRTPASSAALRPSLSATAAARDNRLPSQCRELRAVPRPTSTRAPETRGDPGGRRVKPARGVGGRGARGAGCGTEGLSGCGAAGLRGCGAWPAPLLPANSPARSCRLFPLPADLQSPPAAARRGLGAPRRAGPPPCPRTSPPGRSLTDLARPAPGCSLRPPPTAQARGRPVPKASGPRVPRPPRPPLPPERRGELGPEPATTAATSGPHSPGPPPGAEAGTARSAAPRPPALPARGGARCGARQGARGGPAGSAARRGSLRAEDLTPGPPPRSPPRFHFPRHPQPVWRRRRRRRRLLRGLQGIPGRPRRREERAGPTHSPASPAGPGPQPQRGERGDAAPRPPGRCPASSRRRGECPASRRRRLSPAVTARRGCVCLQLLQSLLLLPTPPRGPGARPGRGGPGRRAGARGSPAHEPRRPLLGAGPEAGGGRWERCAARRPRDPGLHSRPGLGPAWRAPTAGRTGNSRSSAESAAGVPGGAGSPPAGRGRSREAEGALEHRVPRGLRVHHGRGTSGSRLEMRSRAAGHLVGREMAPTQKVRWNLRAVTLSPGRTYICEDHLRLDLHLSADTMPFCSEVHALPPANPTMFDGGLVTAGAYGHFNPILL